MMGTHSHLYLNSQSWQNNGATNIPGCQWIRGDEKLEKRIVRPLLYVNGDW